MNYKKLLVATAIVLLSFSASTLYAAATKVGVINVQQIITECKAGKSARTRFEKEVKVLQDSLTKDQENLEKLKAEIEKKKSVWTEKKTGEKIRAFQVKGREFQAKGNETRYKVKQIQDKELAPILKTLEGVVAKYGKANGYSVILDQKSGVVYFNPSVLLTEKILKKLDAIMPK